MKLILTTLLLSMVMSATIFAQTSQSPTSLSIGFETAEINDDTLFVWDKIKGYLRSGYFDAASSNFAQVGDFSHSFGKANIASGDHTFAAGERTHAEGLNATSLGWFTHAVHNNSLAIGRYNRHFALPDAPLFTVGIGWNEPNRENAFVVTSSGIVGIGDVDPNASLHLLHKDDSSEDGFKIENVDGNYWRFFTGSSQDRLALFHHTDDIIPVGFFDPSGVFNANSDRRRKTDIVDLPYSLSTIEKLNPKKYRFKHVKDLDKMTLGFIAQEVIEIIPELVNYNSDTDQYHMNYDGFSVLGVKAIQELKDIIDTQQKEITELKSMISKILSTMEMNAPTALTTRE